MNKQPTQTKKSKSKAESTQYSPSIKIDKDQKKELDVDKIKQYLNKIENDIQQVRDILFSNVHRDAAKKLGSADSDSSKTQSVIEGVFDGKQMIDKSGKKYPVSENYASKSKLVEGDTLKLKIGFEGDYIFKQIGPVERKKIIGVLTQHGGKYLVNVENKKYQVLTASITYFKAKLGDKLTILVPKSKESQWAVVENIIG